METKKELTPYFKALEKREEIFRRIEIGLNLLVLLSVFINRECFFILLALVWYCKSIFYAGYRSQVCDEWESGYIKDGLRYLYKGLLALPLIALAIFWIFKTDGVYECYVSLKSCALYYLFVGALCLTVVYNLQNAFAESYRYRKRQQ